VYQETPILLEGTYLVQGLDECMHATMWMLVGNQLGSVDLLLCLLHVQTKVIAAGLEEVDVFL
jgi:hypothetical protein